MAGSTPPPVSGNAPTPLNATDPRRLGRYEVIGRLGQGGMGTVFLGRSAEGVPVAIKVIKPDLAEAPEFRARFRREAESARRVRRFTTAAVLDADPDGPQPYLVTEYVEGPTLSKMVARRGPLRPADLEQLALSVATALSAIHAAGIVHRDLTPANVLLSPVGPKVIDFGLARDFEGSGEFSRTARHAIGTPGYMAPEQILDAPVTSAADVFAWGAITIFAATGRPPFGEGRIEALLYRILYEPANIDGVPEELAPLVDAALQKEPDRRPTAEALRGALMSGDLTFNSAATLVGPGTGQPAGQEADRDAAQGGRRRRGSLFGRGGRDQDAQDAPVTAAPGTAQPTTATSATTSLLTPPPATTSRLPAAPAASPTTPASPIPAPPGSIRPPQTPTSPVPGGGPPRPTAKTPSGLPAGRQAPPVPPHPGPAAGGQHGAGDAPDEARRRSGRRKVVLVIAGLAALAVAAVAIPLALAGGSGDGGSNSAAGRAAVSTALARQAADVRAQDPAKASRLSLAAYRISPTDAATAAMAASFTAGSWVDLPGPATTYTGGAVSADGRLAAATDNAGRLRLWDLSNPDSPTQVADVATADAGAGAIAFDPRFLPSGILVTGGEAGHTWGLTDPKAPSVLGPLSPQTGDVARLAISGDGNLLATVDQDRTIELWDLSDPAKPRSLRPLQSTGLTTDIALSPDGHTLAVAGVGGAVTLFDVSNPMNPSRRGQAAGHLGQVNAVAFLADGSRLVTGGDDATVRLWDITDLANPRQVGAEWRGPSAGVLDVVPVGKSLVVSTDAGGALLGWDLTAAQAGPVGFALGGHATPRHVAAGGDGKWLLSVPTGTQAGAASLGSTDPARLATLACLTSANRISAAEWASLGIDLAYEDPCAG